MAGSREDDSNTPPACEECGGTTYDDVIQIAVWSERGLVAIDDVPARICEGCAEQFYDEETTSAIRKLITSGFPRSRMIREIRVPVFSLHETKPDDTSASSSAAPGADAAPPTSSGQGGGTV